MLKQIRTAEKELGIDPISFNLIEDNPGEYLDWLHEQAVEAVRYQNQWGVELGLDY